MQRESSGLVSLESLKAKFDTLGAIRRELERLPRGKLMQEADLRQLVVGFDAVRFRRAVENNADALRAYRIKVRTDRDHEGKWFWGHPEDIAELQEAINL